MDPKEFDALVNAGTGFYTQNQMVSSGINNQMAQQALQNVQAMQTQVPMGNVPGLPNSPDFNKMTQQLTPMFFALINNEQKGPFSLEQLKGLAIADVINEATQIWQQGTPAWQDMKTCLANLKFQ